MKYSFSLWVLGRDVCNSTTEGKPPQMGWEIGFTLMCVPSDCGHVMGFVLRVWLGAWLLCIAPTSMVFDKHA